MTRRLPPATGGQAAQQARRQAGVLWHRQPAAGRARQAGHQPRQGRAGALPQNRAWPPSQQSRSTACASPRAVLPPAQLDEIDASEEKEIDEIGAHNKRNECTPRVSSDDATSCLQQCARHPSPHAHLSGRRTHSSLTRPSLAPRPTLTRPSRLLRAGSSTASGSTRATTAASRSASESSCNECIHRTRPPARREALLNRASLSQHAHEYWACMHPSCSMSLVAQSRGLCLCWRKLSAYVDLACAVLYIYAYIPITVPLF